MFDIEVVEPVTRAYVPSVVDALLSPDDVAGWVAAAVPGPVTAQLIGLLDPVTLSAAGRVDLLVATERLGSWIAAVSHRTVAAMAAAAAPTGTGARGGPDGDLLDFDDAEREGYLREELMAALRLGWGSAEDRVDIAEALTGPPAATHAALQSGTVTPFQAVLMAKESAVLREDAARTAVQDQVLPAAGGQSYAQFRRALRRAITAVDTRQVESRHRDAVEDRRVVKTALWRRLVTDRLGGLLDYGRTTYVPPTALAEHVIARDRICVFVSCGQPARRCDLDHREAWEDGGVTSEHNMHAVCERHHVMKHATGWTYEPTEHGGVIWTSPTGHTYRTRPDPYPIDHPEPTVEPDDPDPPPF